MTIPTATASASAVERSVRHRQGSRGLRPGCARARRLGGRIARSVGKRTLRVSEKERTAPTKREMMDLNSGKPPAPPPRSSHERAQHPDQQDHS